MNFGVSDESRKVRQAKQQGQFFDDLDQRRKTIKQAVVKQRTKANEQTNSSINQVQIGADDLWHLIEERRGYRGNLERNPSVTARKQQIKKFREAASAVGGMKMAKVTPEWDHLPMGPKYHLLVP